MITKLVTEAIIYSLVYSVLMLMLFKVQGAKRQLYNYPPAIRDRAVAKGIIINEELDANEKKNKIIGVIGMVVLCIVITCVVNKQYTFFDGFLQAYIF